MGEQFAVIPAHGFEVRSFIASDQITIQFLLLREDQDRDPRKVEHRYSLSTDQIRQLREKLGVLLEDLDRRNAELRRPGPS